MFNHLFKHLLFFASIIAVVSLLSNLILLGSYFVQTDRIRSLESAISGLRENIVALDVKSHVMCTNPVLESSAGKQYAMVGASADIDGKVTLVLKNLHDDPIFAINIREVLVGYDKKQGRIAADYRSAPTFKEVGLNSTCSGIIDPGDSLTCESASFRDVIETTLEDGDDTFLIKHLAVELDLKPYYFVASDICVRIS